MKNFRDLFSEAESAPADAGWLQGHGWISEARMYGLSSQMRRCASSAVATNLAEGCGKRGNAEVQAYLKYRGPVPSWSVSFS